MSRASVENYSDPQTLRLFMKGLLTDLRALERMLAEDRIETGVRRIGAEQELVLVDSTWRAAPVAEALLAKLDDPRYATELARFNLEINVPPLVFGGDCLRQLEHSLNDALAKARAAAGEMGVRILLTGILPTLHQSDLELHNMTPRPRYLALNEALRRMRGGAFEVRFSGTDELIIRHDSVMLEACNTSAQFHFQVGPREFARLYNIAQVVAAPVLAVAANSPLLFGKRLMRETRIALFQQAVDTRQPGHHTEERSARVSFGDGWVRDSVVEIFRADIARYRVVLGVELDEEPLAVLETGGVPRLRALQMHNGTVYRWNRACYGVTDGRAHLRIENRILPAGPTVADEVANAAFWFGLISGMVEQVGDVTDRIEFDTVKANFFNAARSGIHTQLTWLDGHSYPARQLILSDLVPLARAGLTASGIAPRDIDHYIGIIEARAASGRTGAQWLLDSHSALQDRGKRAEQMAALTAAAWTRQEEGHPVHQWPLARMEEAGGWAGSYRRVDQYMTTDVFTVHEDEVIDLVANLMDWAHIRHVPVTDDQYRLVGLISYRQLLRFLAHDLPHGRGDPVPVRTVMQRNPITIGPETPTLEAVTLMRSSRVACLPVVKDGRLVGIVTERDFIGIAAQLLEAKLRESEAL